MVETSYPFPMKRFLRTVALFLTLPLSGLCGTPGRTTYAPILPLKPEEGVFAYSRISPDGKFLSYASEIWVKDTFLRTVNIVDLERKKVLFSEPGLDSYWAPDGEHVIFLSQTSPDETAVCIWNRKDGSVTRNIAPPTLGDYFTWGQSEGRNVILTQENHYYYLENGKAVRPYRTVPAFPPLGAGEQPMISKDGKRITTFYRGTILIRGLDEQGPVIETKLGGGKGDFSYDGRYVAFHFVQKGADKDTYQIRVVDLKTKEFLQVTDLPGSCYYPSWTRDGQLAFRYDSKDYRGFMMATGFLDGPRYPLPETYPGEAKGEGRLSSLFSKTPPPIKKVVVVNFWAGWCVHCRGELPILNQIRKELMKGRHDAEIIGACDPTSFKSDRDFILQRSHLDLPQIDITSKEVKAFGIQVYPSTLVFVDGHLVEKHHGALTRKSAVALFQKYGIQLHE